MSFDAHSNFSYSTVATAPSPASSGTSLVVASGDGAKFPAAPFNATVWPASSQPTTANAEIVRVTAKSTDTFTITRAQESSSARSIGVGDQIAATITAKTITDVEAGSIVTIFDSTLSVDTASFDTGANGIPSGYSAITITLLARTDEAGTISNADLTINNDTGTNYDIMGLTGNQFSAATSFSQSQTSVLILVHGSGGSTSYPAMTRIAIPFYDQTSFYKVGKFEGGAMDATGAQNWYTAKAFTWKNTAAITRIALSAAAGQKFKAGSRLRISGTP